MKNVYEVTWVVDGKTILRRYNTKAEAIRNGAPADIKPVIQDFAGRIHYL